MADQSAAAPSTSTNKGMAHVLQQVRLPRDKLNPKKLWVVFEIGGCLVKVFYASKKDNEPDATEVTMYSKTFLRKEFDDALLLVKEEALLDPSSGRKCSILGKVSVEETEKVKTVLQVDIEQHSDLKEEFTNRCRGFVGLLKHVPREEYCHTPPTDLPFHVDIKTAWKAIDNMQEMLKKQFNTFNQTTEGIVPCLFAYYGSTGYVWLVDKDGKADLVYFQPLVGPHYRGLAQAVVGTRDYGELCELASRGFRGNVDTQVKDVFPVNDGANPYGALPPDLPILNFGKLVDVEGLSLETVRREDMANSIVALSANFLWQTLFTLSLLHKVTHVYLCGPFYQGDIFRQCLQQTYSFWGQNMLKFDVVKAMYIEPLGALLAPS